MRAYSLIRHIILSAILYPTFICTQDIGLIENGSLQGSPSSFINATCETCLCAMINASNTSILSINCFSNPPYCQFFFNYSSFTNYSISADSNARFFFRHPPPVSQSMTTMQHRSTFSPITTQSLLGKLSSLPSSEWVY